MEVIDTKWISDAEGKQENSKTCGPWCDFNNDAGKITVKQSIIPNFYVPRTPREQTEKTFGLNTQNIRLKNCVSCSEICLEVFLIVQGFL